MDYIFKSKRIGFRNWLDSDLEPMTALNADPEVMRFFPKTLSMEETQKFISRMKDQFEKNGFCYFAVDSLETNEFMGCIGCAEQSFESPYTPCIDIGWRLHKNFWGKGYATEGARTCLEYMESEHDINNIKCFAPQINVPSVSVMQKIGMRYLGNFIHPALLDTPHLQSCVAYQS